MKKILLGILTIVLLNACSKDDDATPLTPDFEVTVTGSSPDAELTITNKSVGANTYSWTFGEGASLSSSTDKTPTSVTVDKAGDLKIKLVVGNGNELKEITKTVSVAGKNAVVTYTDIAFGLQADDETYGRLFSFEEGRIFKDSEINENNGSKIHLAFGSMANTMYYFESPTENEYNVPNATATDVINYESTPSITIDAFDAMNDDSLLSALTIVGTEESFGNSTIPCTILFKLSSGKKGVIKAKAVNSSRLLVDIKVQKY